MDKCHQNQNESHGRFKKKKYDKTGFLCEDRLPEIDDMFFEGTIGYHIRGGTHYFSREDWLKLIDLLKQNGCQKVYSGNRICEKIMLAFGYKLCYAKCEH